MNKVFKVVILLIIPYNLFCQTIDIDKWKNFGNYYDNLYKPLQKAEIINISFCEDLSASKLNNKFFYPFVLNKNLEKKDIDDNLEKNGLKKINIQKNYNISYINLKKTPFKNKNIHWLINAGTDSRKFIKLSNDAAKLIFRGNTDTTKYYFDDCYYYNIKLNKAGVGIFIENEKAVKQYNFSIALNIIQVENYTSFVSFKNNYLLSNEDSFEVGLNYDATFASSKLSGFDGMGLSTDISFNYKLSKNSIWGIKIQNLGFAKFKNSITFYTSNNEYKFDGIHIPDISSLNNSLYFRNQIDSTVNEFTSKRENLDKTLFIAPRTEINFTTHHKTGYYSALLRHNGTKSAPEISLRYFNFIKSFLIAGASVGYMNSIFINSDASFSFRNKYFLQIGINHIEAILLPSKLGGAGVCVGLQMLF